MWKAILKQQFGIRRKWLSDGLRPSVILSASTAPLTVLAKALKWTLTTLDEDKEVEDFVARMPGLFDSRAVPDATSAILPLMSHYPKSEPILGSRLYDLLKTCRPGASFLTEERRKYRLRVCMKTLWYFGRAYNQLGAFYPLPSYFPDALASPEIIRHVQKEGDTAVRVMGRCFGVLTARKLITDLKSRDEPSDGELSSLSAILRTEKYDVRLLLRQPGAIAVANMISLTFDNIDNLVADELPSDVQDVVHQTLRIFSRELPATENAELQLNQPISIIHGSDGTFERILASRLLDNLSACVPVTSPLTEDVRTCYLRLSLKGLWHFGRVFNQIEHSARLPSFISAASSSPEMTSHIREHPDLAVRVIGHCVRALVVNKLATNVDPRNLPVNELELTCLSAILDTQIDHVTHLLSHPGAVEFTNMIFLASRDVALLSSDTVSPDVLDIVRQTFIVISRSLPPELNARMQLDQPGLSKEVTHSERDLSYNPLLLAKLVRQGPHLL